MSENNLWKYCTPDQVKATLRSLNLLDQVPLEKEKYFSCLYSVSNHTEQHYQVIKMKKKNGGVRRLSVPDFLLGRIQKNILHHVLYEFPVSAYATAYKPGYSMEKNAEPHVGKKQILQLDIRDFFDNISFVLVYQYAFPAVYYPPAIRTILADLCCFRDVLPQGAPTSPAVSNLVMRPFDDYMGKWCEERQIHYTRYCDDLTFSGDFDWREVKNKVKGFLGVYGFELNEKKTKISRKSVRQTVTGIVVNEKPQVGRDYRRKLRAEIYYCGKYGVESHLSRCGEDTKICADIKENMTEITQEVCIHYLQQLLGKVNYILQVNPEDAEFLEKRELVKKLLSDFSCTLDGRADSNSAQAGGRNTDHR